tara:strand:- start:1884 stop:2057 length:174 start_codon:yes stop_codon:yes gene_type:complete
MNQDNNRDNIFFAERRIFKLWCSGEITSSQRDQLMRDRGWSEKEINFLTNTLTWVLF